MYERTKETRPRRNLSLRVIYGDHDKIASPQVQRHSQSRLEDLAVIAFSAPVRVTHDMRSHTCLIDYCLVLAL